MKRCNRLLLLAIVAILSIGTANAEFRFGIKAGLNMNNLKFDKTEMFSDDNRCGWTAGVMTEFQVPVIGICADLSVMYTRMNSTAERETIFGINPGQVVDDATEGTIGKNFIEIPLNIKYKFTIPVVASVFKPYVYTGPTFAIKCDKNAFKYIQTKTCQVAWNVGIGVELIRHLQIQGSYGFGINNIADGAFGIKAQDMGKLKNNYWTVTAAWLF